MAEPPKAPLKTPDFNSSFSPGKGASAGSGGADDDLANLRSFGHKKSLSTSSVPDSEGEHQEAAAASSFAWSSSPVQQLQQPQQQPALRSRRAQFADALKSVGTSPEQVEAEVWQFAEDRGEDRSRYIRGCNQLVVTVLEARGLRGADQSGFSDPCVPFICFRHLFLIVCLLTFCIYLLTSTLNPS
jgi:hypothetical protein